MHAWSLVQTMNACFRAPLVHAARGGQKGGGTGLTEEGKKVLATLPRDRRHRAPGVVHWLGTASANIPEKPGQDTPSRNFRLRYQRPKMTMISWSKASATKCPAR